MAFKVNYGPTGTTLVQVGDQFYLTYEVKGKKLYWSVSKSQLNSITDAGKLTFNEDGTLATSIEGFKIVNPGTWNALQENGTLWNAGTLLEIQNNEYQIDTAVNAIIAADEELPWGEDEEYLSLIAELIIEDKENWTTNLTLDPDSRFENILTKYNYDTAMYNRKIAYKNNELGRLKLVQDGVDMVKDMLIAMKASLDNDTIEWIANKWASADWSDAKLQNQLEAGTQKNSIHEIDSEFDNVLSNGVVGYSNKGVEEVTKLIETWLPKELQKPYLEDIQNLAGKYINDVEFADTFTNKLKDERYAFNSSWDKEIPWINVKNNVMTLAASIWGITPAEDDVTLNKVMTINDVAEQKRILREEGLNRGYETTMGSMLEDMTKSFGTGVIKSTDYQLNLGD